MRTVSFNDLELICESIRDLVLRFGDANDNAKLPQINPDAVQKIVNLNDQQYQALPKEEWSKAVLETIVESYDFSASVKKQIQLLG